MGKYKLISIRPSTNPMKKYMAKFKDKGTNKIKITHFGYKGMSDYTKHKDPERKKLYIKRHQKRENWKDPTSAGALSRWVLWNKPGFRESVNDFKKRFNL